MKFQFLLVPAAIVATATAPAQARVYMDVAAAQQMLFPGATFEVKHVTLDQFQFNAIIKDSNVNIYSRNVKAWKASTGGWFVLDQVRGKDKAKQHAKQHPFTNRLVGETAKLAESLMLEYQYFIEQPVGGQADNNSSPVANINPAGQGVKKPGEQDDMNKAQTTNTLKPQGTNPTTPDAAAAAAQAALDKQALKKGLSSLRTVAPNQNIDRAVHALQSDPTKLGPADAKALGDLTNDVIEPMLKDPATAGTIRNAVAKLKAK